MVISVPLSAFGTRTAKAARIEGYVRSSFSARLEKRATYHSIQMDVLIDTTTIRTPRSGTGVYAHGLYTSLRSIPSVEHMTVVGGHDEAIGKDPKTTLALKGETNWHRAINLRMLANQPNFSADVAFFPNYFMPPGFSIPSVVTIHDVSFITHPQFYSRRFSTFYVRRIRHTVQNAGIILTVSKASKCAIIDHLGMSEKQIRVISPGPSLIRNANFNQPVERPFFLYAGTIEPKKNVVTMIDGFLQSGIETHDLALVGHPAVSRGYFRQIMRRVAGSGGRIRFPGFVPQAQLTAMYMNCSGVINLSHIEGYSFPIRDAFHFRKPSLISRDPALREMCKGHAVTVDAANVAAVADGFGRLAALSAGADFEQYVHRLDREKSWSRFSEKLSELLNEVAQRPVWSGHSPKDRFTPIRTAIIRSVCYAGCFGAPALIARMHRALPQVQCSEEQMTAEIKVLAERHPERIKIENDHLSLRHMLIDGDEVCAARSANRQFVQRHRRLIGWLRRLPWCRQMFFSGNTVHGSPSTIRDLDLFIVSAPNRVWLLFTLIRIVSLMTRKHRVVCNNYMVDEEAVTISHERDFYSAFELIHLEPASDQDHREFILARNEWVYSFFPNAAACIGEHAVADSPKKSRGRRLGSLLNLVLMAGWTRRWKRMGLKNLSGGVLWDAHRIKLHVEDHRPVIRTRFDRILTEAVDYLSEKTLRRSA